jgi:iron(III) transport system substrate-binding protein
MNLRPANRGKGAVIMRKFVTTKNAIIQVGYLLFLLGLVMEFLWLPALSRAESTAASRQQELAKLIEGAKAEGTVVWRDGLKPEESGPVVKAFQQKYPFIKVDHKRVSGTDSRERIFRELTAGTVFIDVYDIGGEQIPTFKQAGLMMKYDWTKAFDVRPEQLFKDQMMLSIGCSLKGVGYNTNMINKNDLPKRWEDLLDPKWKGKIVVDTRPKSFCQLMPIWGEEKVYDYVKKLMMNKPIFRRGQTESIELMAAGEFPMIAGTYRSSMELVKKKGAPVDMLYFDILPVTLEEEAIAANAPHPNAAKLLLGWLGREGQKYYDSITARGIPLQGFDTEGARIAKTRKLSLFIKDWVMREEELMQKTLKAMGRE